MLEKKATTSWGPEANRTAANRTNQTDNRGKRMYLFVTKWGLFIKKTGQPDILNPLQNKKRAKGVRNKD